MSEIIKVSGDFSPLGPGWPEMPAAKRALREHPIGGNRRTSPVIQESKLMTRIDLEKHEDYLESL
jgi:hypothetical protein